MNPFAQAAKFLKNYFQRKTRRFLQELSPTTRNALMHYVTIRNNNGNTTRVTYADFLTKWHRNGWRLAQRAPRSNAVLSLRRFRINFPRTLPEVRVELQWGRSPIPESVYARARPQQYAREIARLQSSNRNVVNPRWFVWAARAVRWAYMRRRIYDRGWDWGGREDPINGLFNFDRAMRRRYGRWADQEPQRIISIDQLGDDFSENWK